MSHVKCWILLSPNFTSYIGVAGDLFRAKSRMICFFPPDLLTKKFREYPILSNKYILKTFLYLHSISACLSKKRIIHLLLLPHIRTNFRFLYNRHMLIHSVPKQYSQFVSCQCVLANIQNSLLNVVCVSRGTWWGAFVLCFIQYLILNI